MSSLTQSTKDDVLDIRDVFEPNLAPVQASLKSGPVAGWFVPKSFQSPNHNNGREPFCMFYSQTSLNDIVY